MENVKPLTHRQRQALATQQVIIEAARALFLEQGYGSTTIEAISSRAGVAVSTVYAVFKNKRNILRAIREAWHQESGQRDIYDRAKQETDPKRRFALAAHATRRQWDTGATMITIYNGAAAIDPEAATELEVALQGRRAAIEQFINISLPMLRPDLTESAACAIYLALTRAEVYQELVMRWQWSPDDYESWLATTLQQQLLPM